MKKSLKQSLQVGQSLSRSLARGGRELGEWRPRIDPAVPPDELQSEMQAGSVPSPGFFFMLGLASVIATFGLIADSTPTIIGAMIIAPLMTPIMSLAFGLVVFDRRLITFSLLTVAAGTAWTVAIAFAGAWLLGVRVTGPEVLSRTSPTLLDLGVALAAGGAAAFVHTRRAIANSIAGVAIAVALVPPLAVCGIGLALGSKAVTERGGSLSEFGLVSGGTDVASDAFVLFLTNLVGILVVAILVFVSQRYGQWKRVLVAVPIVMASWLLIMPLERALHELYVKNRVLRLAATLPEARPDLSSGEGKLTSTRVFYRDGALHVSLEAFVQRDWVSSEGVLAGRINEISRILSEDVGEPVILEMNVIPVEIVRVRSESQGPAGEISQR